MPDRISRPNRFGRIYIEVDMTVTMKEKKRPRIMPYGFAATMDFRGNDTPHDVIPVILCWVYENIGEYDKERWQIRTHMGTSQFLSIYFADPIDATAFKLAWV